MKVSRVGFFILGLALIVYAILGFYNIEVWIKLEGWKLLDNKEISIFALIGTLLIFFSLKK